MNEYIERKAVFDKLEVIYDLAKTNQRAVITDALREVSHIPAAEVQPVKRGKWKKKKGYLVCSNCGMTFDTIGYTYEEQEEVFRYCSCCGYRMDGDTE